MKTVPKHNHLYDDKWYPLNRSEVRRVCCYPGCHQVEVKKVK